jgi:ribosomal protein RSM22 (predicted rRNA methylase)
VNVETELNLLETYKMKEANEKRNLQESMSQLEATNQRKIELLQEYIVAAKREKELEAEVENLKGILEKRRSLIQEVKGISHCSFVHRPSKFVEDIDDETVESDFRWMPCAVCECPFPKKDVILAPCMCLYHPWCVVMQNWKSNSYARESCKKAFGEAWQRSHGLFQIQGNAKLLICVVKSF